MSEALQTLFPFTVDQVVEFGWLLLALLAMTWIGMWISVRIFNLFKITGQNVMAVTIQTTLSTLTAMAAPLYGGYHLLTHIFG